MNTVRPRRGAATPIRFASLTFVISASPPLSWALTELTEASLIKASTTRGLTSTHHSHAPAPCMLRLLSLLALLLLPAATARRVPPPTTAAASSVSLDAHGAVSTPQTVDTSAHAGREEEGTESAEASALPSSDDAGAPPDVLIDDDWPTYPIGEPRAGEPIMPIVPVSGAGSLKFAARARSEAAAPDAHPNLSCHPPLSITPTLTLRRRRMLLTLS